MASSRRRRGATHVPYCSALQMRCTFGAVRTLRVWGDGVGAKWRGSTMRKMLSWALGFGVLAGTLPAGAQARTFTSDRAQVCGAPDDGFMAQRTYWREAARFYVNAALRCALDPVRDEHLQEDLQLEGGAP